MEPEMTSKALEPVKGNLTVGSTGIDHSGPNFSEREYVVLTLNNIDRMGYFPASKPQAGDRIRVQYLDNGEKRDWPLEPKQKQHNSAMAERLAQAKKIPGWLTEDRISWTSQMAYFIGWLAAEVKIFSDTPRRHSEQIERMYHSITGRIRQWDSPPPRDAAYGVRAIITFRPTELVPDCLVSQLKEGNKIQRMSFLWALLKLGFDFVTSQDVALIRSHIPSENLGAFDTGVGNQSKPPTEGFE